MEKSKTEIAVGVFVLIGLLCVGYLTIRLGRLEIIGSDYYHAYALFASVSGLKPGAAVEIAGVQVGRVDAISLEPQKQLAKVRMKIERQVELTDDVIAAVKSRGLIGDKYVKLEPGGSETLLKDGDVIRDTQSAVDLEDMIGKYAFGDIDAKQ